MVIDEPDVQMSNDHHPELQPMSLVNTAALQLLGIVVQNYAPVIE